MANVENCIIIGSGPAGYTAAIYLARANLSPLLFAGSIWGGQLMLTSEVDNYPGFPKGIKGPELMQEFRKQAERFDTRIFDQDVTEVDLASRPFKLTVSESTYLTKTVIIATGASSNWLGIESEQKLIGRGVSSCATCDGFFFKGKDVAVVGGGDSAMEEATYLSKIVRSVTVIHRRDKLRASKIMQDKAFNTPNIKFIWNSTVTEVEDVNKGAVTGVKIQNTVEEKPCLLPCSALFVAIGHTPNTKIFKGKIDLDEKGYIKTKNGTSTNIPGVFASGDVQDHVYRQAVTAAGTGCMAALDCERYLENHG